MNRKLKTITVHIMEREYPVACPQGEETTLMNAVDYTDRVMKKIKRAGRTVGIERIAVMAAINMAHDLLALQRKISHLPNETAHQALQAPALQTETLQSYAAQEDDTPENAEPTPTVDAENTAMIQQLQQLTERLETALREDAATAHEKEIPSEKPLHGEHDTNTEESNNTITKNTIASEDTTASHNNPKNNPKNNPESEKRNPPPGYATTENSMHSGIEETL